MKNAKRLIPVTLMRLCLSRHHQTVPGGNGGIFILRRGKQWPAWKKANPSKASVFANWRQLHVWGIGVLTTCNTAFCRWTFQTLCFARGCLLGLRPWCPAQPLGFYSQKNPVFQFSFQFENKKLKWDSFNLCVFRPELECKSQAGSSIHQVLSKQGTQCIKPRFNTDQFYQPGSP